MKPESVKYTTKALEQNQYLRQIARSSIVESYCIGYTNQERDKRLDGYYYTKELIVIRD